MGTRLRGVWVGSPHALRAKGVLSIARSVAIAVALLVMVWPVPPAQSFEGHRLYDPGAYVLLNLLAAADSGSPFMMLAVVRQAVGSTPEEVEDVVAAAVLLMPWLRDDIVDAALEGFPAPGNVVPRDVVAALRSVAAQAAGLVPGTGEWETALVERPLPPRGLIERVAHALAAAEQRVSFAAVADATPPPRHSAAIPRAIPATAPVLQQPQTLESLLLMRFGLPAGPVLPGPPPPESRFLVPSGS